MNKYLLLTALFITTAIVSSAQLANTKWKGMANVPDPYESVFEFRKDTLIMTVDSDMVVETMSFKLQGDTLVLTKLEGKSPCENNSPGYFKITFAKDTFTLVSLKDECPERAAAFITAPWVRMKE